MSSATDVRPPCSQGVSLDLLSMVDLHGSAAPRYRYLRTSKFGTACGKLDPLPKLHGLGSIPLTRGIRARRSNGLLPWFTPYALTLLDLCLFPTIPNVQELKLRGIFISSSIPEGRCYFGRFSSELRSTALPEPRCTLRRPSYPSPFFRAWTTSRSGDIPLPPSTDTWLITLSAGTAGAANTRFLSYDRVGRRL